jgi:hypothetical protein
MRWIVWDAWLLLDRFCNRNFQLNFSNKASGGPDLVSVRQPIQTDTSPKMKLEISWKWTFNYWNIIFNLWVYYHK